MAGLYSGNGFVVQVPDGWQSAVRSSSVAFFRIVGGNGAINISESRLPDNGTADSNELFQMLSQGSVMPQPVDTWQENVEVVYGQAEREGKFWQYWVMSCKNFAVFVSYNCRIENRDEQELREVTSLVRGVEFCDN